MTFSPYNSNVLLSPLHDNRTMIEQTLKEIGLSREEIQIYLAALELGSQPASIIAKKAGLKRGQTYNKLNLLIQKGIVQEFIKDKVRYFTTYSPKTLISILEHRGEEIENQKQKLLQAIPFLDKIRNPFLNQPKVRFFQGVEGIKEIYEDTIRVKNQPIYAIGDFDYIFPANKNKELNDWIWSYATRRAKKGVEYIGIINKSEYSDIAFKRRKPQKRKMKMLQNVHLPVEVNVYGDKVAIMSTYKDMVGLIIEDKHIAETLRNLHQSFWNFLLDYK